MTAETNPPVGDEPAVDPAPQAGAMIADRDANADLEHTRGGTTTRADMTDAGVPMLQGQPDEPVGPEDALGPGPKRGDYSGRLAAEGTLHTDTVVIPDDEREKMADALIADRFGKGDKGQQAADEAGFTRSVALGEVPRTRLVDQTSRAADVGDAPGKGGVTTASSTDAG